MGERVGVGIYCTVYGGGKIRERAVWERVGVMIYSILVEEESGKGQYGREGWSRDIQYMSGGRIRERAIWERGLG